MAGGSQGLLFQCFVDPCAKEISHQVASNGNGEMDAERLPIKIGLIYPPGGGEHEYYELAEALNFRVMPCLTFAYPVTIENGHSLKALRMLGNPSRIAEIGASLISLNPHAVMWACTSGSFISGKRGAEQQLDALRDVVNCPVSSTSIAFIQAMKAFSLTNVSIVATYPEKTAIVFRDFLMEYGIAVTNMKCLGATSGRKAYQLPEELIITAAKEVDCSQGDAVLIPDTAIPSLGIIQHLESDLGKPVFGANQVTLWEAMRLVGSRQRLHDFGSLFSN